MPKRPPSTTKRLRKALEFQLTRLGLVVIPRMRRPTLVKLSRILAAAAFHLDRRDRKVGMQNLNLVFGDSRSPEEKRKILRQSFATFALVLADVFWFTRSPRERLRQYVKFDDTALEALSHTPLICVTGHLGNWETLGQAVANAGFPLHSVAAPLSNPAVDQLFIPSRQLSGQKILSSEGALRKLLRILRDGGRFAILLDQNTKPTEGGLFVPFLGLPAPVSTGAAMLATRTGSNLLFGYALPQADGTYRVITPHSIGAEEVASMTERGGDQMDALTARIAVHLEETIRAHPGCWLWMYKRWKYIAPGHAPTAYPAYAKPLPEQEQSRARIWPATAASRPE